MKPPSSQHLYHHVLIVLLLIILPPIAWYQMWRKPRYHPWFSYVLWFNGIITIGIFGYFLFFAYPQLIQILASLGLSQAKTNVVFTIHILLLIFGIFEISVGIYLKKHFRNAALLTKPQITLVIILLFLNLLTIPISQLAITAAVPHVKENPIAANPLDSTANSDLIGANWNTYTNTTYNFTLKYPPELSGYLQETPDKKFLTIGYPGPADVDLFSVYVYPSTIDAKSWWNQNGKKLFPWIFNTAFNNIAIPSHKNGVYSEIKGIEGIGQRKSPGGVTLSTSVTLLPHNGFIYVIWDNTKDYKYETERQSDQILSTFKFLDEDAQLKALAEQAMKVYFDQYKLPAVSKEWRLDDYKIESISGAHIKGDSLAFAIIYSVKIPANITFSQWQAGNGIENDNDPWIRNKSGSVEGKKVNGFYVVDGIATGVGAEQYLK